MVRSALLALGLVSLPAAAADLDPLYLQPGVSEGCWVRFFEAPGFEEPMGRVGGSLYVNSIANPGLIGPYNEREFFQRARSLVVGPEAELIAYAEPGFRKELIKLQPGEQVADLRSLGFPKEIASLKIDCRR